MNERASDLYENQRDVGGQCSPRGSEEPVISGANDYLVHCMMRHVQELDQDETLTTEPAVLAPFWGPGDLVIFSGEPGCGKTYLAADILLAAVCPERQGRALGGLLRFDPDMLDGGRIAILDAENDRQRWSGILGHKMAKEGLSAEWSQVRYVPTYKLGLGHPEKWETHSRALAGLLHRLDVVFYVGDTLARIWSPENVNATDWVQKGLAPFRTACREYGISGLMLSHTRRWGADARGAPTGPLGTSLQEAQADGQILLNRTHQSGRDALELSHRKSRRSHWIRQGSKVVALLTAEYSYQPIGQYMAAWPHEPPGYDPAAEQQTQADRVLRCLRDALPGSLGRSDLESRLGIAESTARLHLNRHLRAGKVDRQGRGRNTQWRLKEGVD
jgi:hypothetical protein